MGRMSGPKPTSFSSEFCSTPQFEAPQFDIKSRENRGRGRADFKHEYARPYHNTPPLENACNHLRGIHQVVLLRFQIHEFF